MQKNYFLCYPPSFQLDPKQFKLFLNTDFISPGDITENTCKAFRRFLVDKYTGETPADYYTRFKWVLAAATADVPIVCGWFYFVWQVH